MGIPKKAVMGGRQSVKVAVVQIAPRFLDRAESVERACRAIAEAGANGAELIVFPEVWLAGYPYWTEGWDSRVDKWIDGRVRWRDAAVLARGEESERIGRAARATNAYVVMGANELDERPQVNTIYNSLLFFGRDGALLGRHRKLMPTFTERMFWGMGDGSDLVVFETDIGRIGGLICGEHLMTLARAAMIAQGEDFHVAVFPGAFVLHTGPQLEEPDKTGDFWGHASVRAHAQEAGAFVLTACGYIDAADVPDDFPYKDKMNIGYAAGGSSIIAPLGVPLVPATNGPQILYAECHAWMIKAWKSIVDTAGHYARPDVLRLQVRGEDGWRPAGPRAIERPVSALLPRDGLRRAADANDVDPAVVEELAERVVARA